MRSTTRYRTEKHMNVLNRLRGRIAQKKRQKLKAGVEAYVQEYLINNDLVSVLDDVDQQSKSTGTGLTEYVLLHALVRHKKPQYILELGTGKSTWILADAVLKNYQESNGKVAGVIISMEEDKGWYDHACSILPDVYSSVVQIHYSSARRYCYGFITGSCYEQVPDHPFEIVFIDGPATEWEEDGQVHEVCNMDLLRVVAESASPVTAFVDSRLRTAIAYSIAFGKEKVKFYSHWGGTIVDGVTKDDLLLNQHKKMIDRVFYDTVSAVGAHPAWLRPDQKSFR